MNEGKVAVVDEVAKIPCMCAPIQCPCGAQLRFHHIDQPADVDPHVGLIDCPFCGRTLDFETGREHIT